MAAVGGSSATLAPPTDPSPGSPGISPADGGRPTRRGWGTPAVLAASFAGYLALSVLVWWGAWSTHPTSVTTCGCGDTSLFLWFLEWPAYAMAHGHNPFYSTALFHPQGIDLLSNTSVLAVGIPLAPVTWLFGPVATLNVASTLAPALSALSMCWLLRRWVRWAPAAFLGGLVYGFSPFVFVNLAGAHLMAAVLVLPPLMVACLDDLLVRRRHRPVVSGAALGLLLTVQFFVGTEVLAMVVVMIGVGIVLVVAYAAVFARAELAARAPHALAGLGVAVGVSAVLLAYPAWFALAGPAHLSGLVWPRIARASGGITLGDLWQVNAMTALQHQMRVIGGYQGPALPQPAYLGLGTLVVLGAGLVVWRRDRRLWLFGALGVVAVVFSLGLQAYWTPWRVVEHVPLVRNVVAGRFASLTALCAAVMLAVIVDRTRRSVAVTRRGAVDGTRTPRRCERDAGPATGGPERAGVLGALAVAALAVVPDGRRRGRQRAPHHHGGHAPGLVRRRRPAPAPGPGGAGLPRPVRPAAVRRGLAGRGRPGLRHRRRGSGPESLPSRAGPERAGQAVISAASFSLSGPPPADVANVDAVRSALAGWGVTTIVVPDPRGLPRYEQGTDPAAALGLFTLAVGRAPSLRRRRLGVDRRAPARAAPSDRCRRLRRLHLDSALGQRGAPGGAGLRAGRVPTGGMSAPGCPSGGRGRPGRRPEGGRGPGPLPRRLPGPVGAALVALVVHPPGRGLDLRLRRPGPVPVVPRVAGVRPGPRPQPLLLDGALPPPGHRPACRTPACWPSASPSPRSPGCSDRWPR